MTQLSADANARIQYDPSAWRLLASDEYDRETPLLEVIRGRPLMFDRMFSAEQRLSTDPLDGADIEQVVVGWSEDDLCWHLGFTLNAERAAQRGGRWVGLAHWYDPTAADLGEQVQEAGQALSAIIGQPFTLIPPRMREKAKTQASSEMDSDEADGLTEDYLLPDLPLRFGAWQMTRDGESFVLARVDRWQVQGLLGVLWYLFWAVAFLLVSVATLLDSLALPYTGILLPDRALLPYLGIAGGVVILGLTLRAVWRLRHTVSRIIITPSAGTITAFMGNRQAWQYTADAIQDVYVTQLMQQRGKRRVIHYGEINLRLRDNRFVRVLEHDHEQEKVMSNLDFAIVDSIAPLRDIDSELQAAAAYIAEGLGDLSCVHDQRRA